MPLDAPRTHAYKDTGHLPIHTQHSNQVHKKGLVLTIHQIQNEAELVRCLESVGHTHDKRTVDLVYKGGH